MNRFLLLYLLSLCFACAGPRKAPPVPAENEPSVSIYVINHGKHAGLVIRRADLPQGVLPESRDFPAADYLELGWGDWDYYQADDPGPWLALKAAFWPTASVLHLVGVQGPLPSRFAGYEVARLQPSLPAFRRLVVSIHRSFDRQGREKATPVGPRHYGDSLFYPARGKFHIFNTCNGWVARVLESAGYPMGIWPPVTADQLMAKVRPFAAS